MQINDLKELIRLAVSIIIAVAVAVAVAGVTDVIDSIMIGDLDQNAVAGMPLAAFTILLSAVCLFGFLRTVGIVISKRNSYRTSFTGSLILNIKSL